MPKVKTSKEEVLKRVIPILRTKGVYQTSMNDLAQACDIQKSHFYYYFNNKEQLIKEVLMMVNDYFEYNLFKIIRNPSFALNEKLLRIHTLIDKMFKTFDGGCIMANTALETIHLDPTYKEEIRSFFGNFISGLQLLLTPNYTKEECLTLAEQIVQDIEGGILLMRIYNDQKYLNNAISRMEKIILKS